MINNAALQKKLICKKQMQMKRRRYNLFALTLSIAAMLFGLIWLVWILFTIFNLGLHGFSLTLFTANTPPPNTVGGGLLNAIVGSFIIVGIATLIGTPIGVLTGIYLAEYGKKSLFANVTRFMSDIMLSAPSIIIGLFVYTFFVVKMGNFSGLAGAFALALLQIPIITRSTENMLSLIPNTLREASFALGVPKWKTIYSITLKASIGGIVTGILLAIARITGETAPLLFTALSNQFFSMHLLEPMANLPVTIFKFALSPFSEWQELAWAGVLLITLSVLGLNIIARVSVRKR